MTTTQPSTIYERLGAEGGIRQAVDDFYDRVVADADLAPYFEGIDMTALRRHQVEMLSAGHRRAESVHRTRHGDRPCGPGHHRRALRPGSRRPRTRLRRLLEPLRLSAEQQAALIAVYRSMVDAHPPDSPE